MLEHLRIELDRARGCRLEEAAAAKCAGPEILELLRRVELLMELLQLFFQVVVIILTWESVIEADLLCC